MVRTKYDRILFLTIVVDDRTEKTRLDQIRVHALIHGRDLTDLVNKHVIISVVSSMEYQIPDINLANSEGLGQKSSCHILHCL